MITDNDLAAVGLSRCGDRSCIFGAHGGMAANGGCRCDRDDAVRWPVSARHAFHRTAELARNIAVERSKLRAALAASQREADRLRHREETAEDGVCPDSVEVVALRAEVERCREVIVSIAVQHCGIGEAGLDSMATLDNAEPLRYLAEIGRVEIVSEHGRRVVARWKP